MVYTNVSLVFRLHFLLSITTAVACLPLQSMCKRQPCFIFHVNVACAKLLINCVVFEHVFSSKFETDFKIFWFGSINRIASSSKLLFRRIWHRWSRQIIKYYYYYRHYLAVTFVNLTRCYNFWQNNENIEKTKVAPHLASSSQTWQMLTSGG